MKTIYLIPLLFLSACSTTPKLVLRPQQPPTVADNSAVRYPEIVRAYHIGRYADPNDDLVMHEQHTVFRVEENTRWDLHPATIRNTVVFPAMPRNAAFSPTPVSDAILAEVNSQRLATAQIMVQARTLSSAMMQFQTALQQTRTNLEQTAAIRVTVSDMKQQLDVIKAAQGQLPSISTPNEAPDSLTP